MAYQRNNYGGGQQKPASKPAAARPQGGYSGGGKGDSKQSAPAKKEKKGGKNKPDFRICMVEKNAAGKYQTVKGDDGKSVYFGAAWKNDFGGFNVKMELDVPAGATMRMYSTADDEAARNGTKQYGNEQNDQYDDED